MTTRAGLHGCRDAGGDQSGRKNVAVFSGSYVNKIDRKGRVSMPAAFRSGLGDGPAGIYVMRSIRGVEALDAFTWQSFVELSESIGNPFDSANDDSTGVIFGTSVLLTLDSEGRMSLPADYRGFARVGDSARFIGHGPFFQIWEPEAGQAYLDEAFRRISSDPSKVKQTFKALDAERPS